MPECRDCHRVLASSELKNLPNGWRCKDRYECERISAGRPAETLAKRKTRVQASDYGSS